MRGKAEEPRWPPEYWYRHEEQSYIAVSQFGLGCYERFAAGEGVEWLSVASRTAEYLVDQQHVGGALDGGWVHLWSFPHTYEVRPPWLSAMAQGEAASLLVRVHRATGQQRFAEAALRALRPLRLTSAEGGVRASLDGGLFFEEVPTNPGSFILNGAIFALWGCYDVGVGLADRDALELFRCGTETLAENIDLWDTGSWSRYDLYPHPLVNLATPFYHQLHISQLRAMQLLRPQPAFEAAISRFEAYGRSHVNATRAYCGKILFRILAPRSVRLARRLPWAHHPGIAATRRRDHSILAAVRRRQGDRRLSESSPSPARGRRR